MMIQKYAVIACPKCRAHAQIIEYGTVITKCQNCSAALKIKKLRLFYSSNILKKAISARTQLQAQIHGQSVEFGSVPEMEFVDDRPSIIKPKKNAQKIILDLLRSADGALEIEILRMQALDNDVDADRFDKILEGLLRTGDVYSPTVGYVRLV
ncbi:MAG: hypothetical protein P1P69_03955 [Methanosarcinaceae archaeon]|nr:hypothetical protein [Methanosarcinaceae archaeon]MDF1533641.1 hypothetical protein [Methanosarcinaceae archaeon]